VAADAAVVFDVDGVLLDLTGAEEDAFFSPFERRHGLTGLSRNWDGYRIRNDEDIIHEILERHLGRLPTREEYDAHCADYLGILANGLLTGALRPEPIAGAGDLLAWLAGEGIATGVATANLIGAARLRLDAAGLWGRLRSHAHGADGGGHKRDILARAIRHLGLPRERIVYIGDNLNDLDAGTRNEVHFIGFAVEPHRRERLRNAGASVVCASHGDTREEITRALGVAN
jgi:phosphoglycolate phosphatase-like HAD superfamily hydrolase